MNIPIENRTFFNHYILHPFSPELSEREQRCYLVATVALGILTACLAQIGTYLYLSLLDKILVKEEKEEFFDCPLPPDDDIFYDCEGNPKVEMSHTFQSIWKNATTQESEAIESIWSSMMKGANIQGWSRIKENHYHLKLENELNATFDEAPGITLVLPQELDIEFSEKESVKTIAFPEKVIHGVKSTFIANIFLASVLEIHVQKTAVTLRIGLPVGSKEFGLSTREALNFWNEVKWAK